MDWNPRVPVRDVPAAPFPVRRPRAALPAAVLLRRTLAVPALRADMHAARRFASSTTRKSRRGRTTSITSGSAASGRAASGRRCVSSSSMRRLRYEIWSGEVGTRVRRDVASEIVRTEREEMGLESKGGRSGWES